MATKKSTTKSSGIAAAGAGVAALAAAATAAYFLTGKKGAANRKKISKAVSSLHKEIKEEATKAHKLGKKEFHSIVNQVSKKYQAMKNADPEEILSAAAELKAGWDTIAGEIAKSSKIIKGTAVKSTESLKKAVKKTLNQPAKKTTKKVAKKK